MDNIRELRRDPISGGWGIVASALPREQGEFLHQPGETGDCRLRSGNEEMTPPELLAFRDFGGANEPGWRIRVVPNFSPVLRVEGTLDCRAEGLFDRINGIGAHEILVESPVHEHELSELEA